MYIAKAPAKKVDITHFYTYYHRIISNGADFKGHRHSFWEMNMLLNGSMTLTCDDKIINLSKGQMYLIPPLEFHKFTTQKSKDIEIVIITFDMKASLPNAVYDLTGQNLEIAMMLVDEIGKAYPGNSFNGDAVVSQDIKLLLELLILRASVQSIVPYTKDVNSDIYENAVDFMRLNLFNNDISVRSIAKHCKVSESTLKNVFSKHTNGGVMHYFSMLKMEYAKELIVKGNTISSIAEELRFSSTPHFSAAFKKYCGMSPLGYKKNYSMKIE